MRIITMEVKAGCVAINPWVFLVQDAGIKGKMLLPHAMMQETVSFTSCGILGASFAGELGSTIFFAQSATDMPSVLVGCYLGH